MPEKLDEKNAQVRFDDLLISIALRCVLPENVGEYAQQFFRIAGIRLIHVLMACLAQQFARRFIIRIIEA